MLQPPLNRLEINLAPVRLHPRLQTDPVPGPQYEHPHRPHPHHPIPLTRLHQRLQEPSKLPRPLQRPEHLKKSAVPEPGDQQTHEVDAGGVAESQEADFDGELDWECGGVGGA